MMLSSAALSFFRALLDRAGVPHCILREDTAEYPVPALRTLAGLGPLSSFFPDAPADRTIYLPVDALQLRYCLLKLPGSGERLFCGPYLAHEMPEERVMELLSALELPPSLLGSFLLRYGTTPVFQGNNMLGAALSLLGEALWGSTENFLYEQCNELLHEPLLPPTREEQLLDTRVIEDRYEREAAFLRLIAQGNARQARRAVEGVRTALLDSRNSDPLRNTKNYAIILNTLMRKTVQSEGVHPLYIDRLSTKTAQRIESSASVSSLQQLMSVTAAEYCRLVREHRGNVTSPAVTQVILHIDEDLCADQSLAANARHAHISEAYLSSLFHAETGMTLSEFVNRRRCAHGKTLLETTGLRIQVIAQYSGFDDANYFSRQFRRLYGVSPSAYRAGKR